MGLSRYMATFSTDEIFRFCLFEQDYWFRSHIINWLTQPSLSQVKHSKIKARKHLPNFITLKYLIVLEHTIYSFNFYFCQSLKQTIVYFYQYFLYLHLSSFPSIYISKHHNPKLKLIYDKNKELRVNILSN